MKKFAGVIAGLVLANEGALAAEATDIIAAKHIRAGAILTASDISTPQDRESMRRAYNMIGLEAKRTYYRGQAIDEDDFKSPTLVARNAIVQMEFEKGPMIILAEGRALDKGSQGERIRVMNMVSKRIITATVTGADSVRAKQ